MRRVIGRHEAVNLDKPFWDSPLDGAGSDALQALQKRRRGALPVRCQALQQLPAAGLGCPS